VKLSLCNELLAADGLSLARQCEAAHALGYMGLELALGSLRERPHEMSDAEAASIRATVEDHGLEITGLHWLLAPYPNASITDPARSPKAQAILLRLTEICALMGGRVLVHGSPAQRQPVKGESPEETADRLTDFFAPVAKAAEAAGVTYCIEPLSKAETSVIKTVAEGAALVDRIGSPAFRTMIDTSAAGQSETEPVADLLRRWLPTGSLAHVQVNDTNRGAPGMGNDPFVDIAAALRACEWPHPVAVEPFRTCINGITTAAIGAATMRTAWNASA
jgi:D-psicose/D-tagatose/L-ribulose 3-epimerase